MICKVSNEKPVFRVGGGFVSFEKFLELYAAEELERLLQYDIDAQTGTNRMQQALKSHGDLMLKAAASSNSNSNGH